MSEGALHRFSKPRGVGDQTSGGREKLLKATSNLSRSALLIRETMQNSWDAALEDWYPAFGVQLYAPHPAVRDLLRERVFGDLDPSLKALEDSLAAPGLHVLEVYDRGTTGLDGPYRATEAPDEGGPNNFNAFVFDIGSSKPLGTAGGTYGFGKTAAFEASAAHTAVYWTACRTTTGQIEHRLIAASLHEPYTRSGSRFTGAHWWGASDATGVIPLVGLAAKELGEALFRKKFGDDDEETGTSILIIDPLVSHVDEEGADGERRPVRTLEQSELLTGQFAQAMSSYGWAKMHRETADHEFPPLIVELKSHDQEIDVPARAEREFGRFAPALDAIRAVQLPRPEAERTPPPGTIEEEIHAISLRPRLKTGQDRVNYFGGREDSTVGHLALVRSIVLPTERSDHEQLSGGICFMRSKAELAAWYELEEVAEGDAWRWHAVFKPTPESDHHFAASEPATHDAWTPNIAEAEASRYVVQRALQQVRRKLAAFRAAASPTNSESTTSVKRLSTALRDFTPIGPTDAPDREPAPRYRPRGKRRHTKDEYIRIDSQSPLSGADGLRSGSRLSIRVDSASPLPITVTVKLVAVTPEGRIELDEDQATVFWLPASRPPRQTDSLQISPGDTAELHVQLKSPLAVEIQLKGS